MTTPLDLPPPTLHPLLTDGSFFIDASTMDHWMHCPRDFYYYRIRKREAAKFYAGREFGKCIHEGLKALYLKEDYRTALTDSYPHGMPVDDHRTLDYAIRLVELYHKTFEGEQLHPITLPSNKLAVEVSFAHPIGSVTLLGKTIPVIWTGKIDLIVRDGSGRHFVLDHKTSIIGGATFWRQWAISQQQRGYAFVANAIVGPIAGYGINSLFTLRDTRTGKGMSVERQLYPLDRADFPSWQENTLHIAHSILRTTTYPMHSSACVRRYGACGFLEVCECPTERMREMVVTSSSYQDVTWSPLED